MALTPFISFYFNLLRRFIQEMKCNFRRKMQTGDWSDLVFYEAWDLFDSSKKLVLFDIWWQSFPIQSIFTCFWMRNYDVISSCESCWDTWRNIYSICCNWLVVKYIRFIIYIKLFFLSQIEMSIPSIDFFFCSHEAGSMLLK